MRQYVQNALAKTLYIFIVSLLWRESTTAWGQCIMNDDDRTEAISQFTIHTKYK